MTVPARAALAAAADRLRAAGVPEPLGDARRLMAHALGVAPARLTLALGEPVEPEALTRFETAVARRAGREPVAQIVGRRVFWGRDFAVTADVLDPRPETETLIAAALELPFERVLDLGTGSGCILLTLLAERPAAQGLGTDISEAALAVARTNARALGLETRAAFRRADWCNGIDGRFDLVVANPPYIAAAEMPDLAPEVREWEPAAALSPGGDGLDAYRAIAAGVQARLAPGGSVLVEIGPTQEAAVAALFAAAGLSCRAVHRDLDGRDRTLHLMAQRRPPATAGG
ncbi:peptide chain release factor N(5)-glutamine methyltransferase [Rhodovulum sp. YNF3179]|uniref:peptide chain release factor N(5)-glutamine methyltransferase n=1 Tax=Rhodovulum sp. YNF3179 TaxID=3425127 RepID=UPI003D3582D6